MVDVRNDLVAPVAIQIAATPAPTATPITIMPGQSWHTRLPRTDSLRLSWRTTAEGAQNERVPALQNSVHVPFGSNLFGTTTTALIASTLQDAYFAPLITNESSLPLTIVANAGLHGPSGTSIEGRCQCVVPPGATRQFVGYFVLFGNSTVHAVRSDNRTATFTNISQSVDRRSGRLGLKFRDADFTRGR
jgi:hypothetical protein